MEDMFMEECTFDKNSNNDIDPRGGYMCGIFCSHGSVCGTFCSNVGGHNCGWLCPGNGC